MELVVTWWLFKPVEYPPHSMPLANQAKHLTSPTMDPLLLSSLQVRPMFFPSTLPSLLFPLLYRQAFHYSQVVGVISLAWHCCVSHCHPCVECWPHHALRHVLHGIPHLFHTPGQFVNVQGSYCYQLSQKEHSLLAPGHKHQLDISLHRVGYYTPCCC